MRKEKYIDQKKVGKTYYFRVRLKATQKHPAVSKSFCSADYPTPATCLNEAVKWRDKKLIELGQMEAFPSELRLDELMDRKEELLSRSMRTNAKHRSMYNLYIRPVVGNKKIKDVQPYEIQRTLNLMTEKCAQHTINRVFGIWRSLYKTARIIDRVPDITSEVEIPQSMCPVNHRQKVTTTAQEIQQVCAVLGITHRRRESTIYNNQLLSHAIWIMFLTGIRPAECFAITRSDIDAENMLLHIRRSIGSTSSAISAVKATKTEQSVRDIPITETVLQHLIAVCDMSANNYIFTQYNGSLPNIDLIADRLSHAMKKQGIDFNLYQCRHTFSTTLITAGTDPRTVQELMGHASADMSVDYARSNNDLKKDAVQIVSGNFREK